MVIGPDARAKIVDSLLEACSRLNKQLPLMGQLQLSEDAPLFGRGAALDSLGLVNFVVCAEETIQERLGIPVSLVSEKAFSRAHSPFRTIGALADFVLELLMEDAVREVG